MSEAASRMITRPVQVALIVVWAVVLVGFAVFGLSRSGPTAREQVRVSAALPYAERAAGVLAAAVDPAATVLVLEGYEVVSDDCRVTAARFGERYEYALTGFTEPGQEAQLLTATARHLPKRYRAGVRGKPDERRLSADPGDFIAVRGTVDQPGRVRFTTDTGCRPGTLDAGTDRGVGPDNAPAQLRTAVTDVLAALRLPVQNWSARQLPCPNGTALWTVQASGGELPAGSSLTSSATTAGRLAQAPPVAGLAPLFAGPATLAYRLPAGDLLLRTEADPTGGPASTLRVSATSRC